MQELKERLFVFQIVSEEVSKSSFIRQLSRGIANTMYRPDPDSYVVHMRPEDLGLSAADFNVVAKDYYSRSLSRVKKAFSFKGKTKIFFSLINLGFLICNDPFIQAPLRRRS